MRATPHVFQGSSSGSHLQSRHDFVLAEDSAKQIMRRCCSMCAPPPSHKMHAHSPAIASAGSARDPTDDNVKGGRFSHTARRRRGRRLLSNLPGETGVSSAHVKATAKSITMHIASDCIAPSQLSNVARVFFCEKIGQKTNCPPRTSNLATND